MFGRHHNTEFGENGAARTGGLPWSRRARLRYRRRADSELISELRWLWRTACMATPLAPMIYTPSGATRAVPLIGHVDLGPPISLRVRVRPGQTLADFVAAAPTIASAMNVADLHVSPLAPQWLRIVLATEPYAAFPDGPSRSDVASAGAWNLTAVRT